MTTAAGNEAPSLISVNGTDRSTNPSRFGFLIRLLLEHKSSYLPGGVMVVATLWMTLTIPVYLEQAVDILRDSPDSGNSGFVERIFWILGFAIAIIGTRTASRLLFFVPGRRVEYDLKNRLLTHLTTLQRDYFQTNPTGAIISRINNDINGVRMLMGFGLMQLCNSIAMLSLAPYRMVQISPRLTLFVVLPIVVAFIFLQLIIRRLRGLQQQQMKALQDISDFTVESYNGLDVLRSYRALAWAEQRFSGFSEAIRDNALRMAILRAYFMPLLLHVVNALKVLLILVGGMMVLRTDLSVGEFMAYLLYLSMILPPLMGMSFMLFVLQRGMTALGSLETVFHTRPTLPLADAAAEQRLSTVLHDGLQVNGLSYCYPDAPEQPVLEDISFSVRPGEIVGVFGPIGSGKSSLINCLNRYLNPANGTIALSGIDINALSLEKLRRHVVTVSQEPFLFSATIADNVGFANEDASDDDIEQALSAAAMSSDLARFPAGKHTLAGEKGINLSGGQKQRIALARALLKPCDLLILDDVLSAVDHDTERYLINQIYRFHHARALLIVSHRISALERADRILVLEQGRITAQGRHQELIAKPGLYQQVYRLQAEMDE